MNLLCIRDLESETPAADRNRLIRLLAKYEGPPAMSFLKSRFTRFVTWSLTLAVVANGPLLSAEQRMTPIPVEETSERESQMQDVKLQSEGVLKARIVDLQGNPVVGEQVSVMFRGKEVAAVVSDEDGFATVSGVRPGLHAIVTPAGTTAVRLWNADTAPPTASAVPAVVSDSELVRGQFGAFNLPMAAVLAASIAGIVIGLDAKNTADNASKENAALEARIEALEQASP